MNTLNVNYKQIRVNNKDIALSDSASVSFKPGFNKISVTCQPNEGLSYFEARVTKDGEDYDIGIGNLAYWDTNVVGSKDYSYTIIVNDTHFNKGDGKYRLSFYAKSSVDGTWDVTYLFFTVMNEKFVPANSEGLEVITVRDAPKDISK